MKAAIGILAYGSLIDDPGDELKKLIVEVIQVKTPFCIEYGRTSTKRGGAPTLVIVSEGGVAADAKIILLDASVKLEDAINMLYRREIHTGDTTRIYTPPTLNAKNRLRIEKVAGWMDIEVVIYASLPQNIKPIDPVVLAELAIASALSPAGDQKMDGINYLKNNITNGIITPMTEEYVLEILKRTMTSNLEEAIAVLDQKRISTE